MTLGRNYSDSYVMGDIIIWRLNVGVTRARATKVINIGHESGVRKLTTGPDCNSSRKMSHHGTKALPRCHQSKVDCL